MRTRRVSKSVHIFGCLHSRPMLVVDEHPRFVRYRNSNLDHGHEADHHLVPSLSAEAEVRCGLHMECATVDLVACRITRWCVGQGGRGGR